MPIGPSVSYGQWYGYLFDGRFPVDGLELDKVCIDQNNIADDLLILSVNVIACQRCMCFVDSRLQRVPGASGSSSRCWQGKLMSRAWCAIQ